MIPAGQLEIRLDTEDAALPVTRPGRGPELVTGTRRDSPTAATVRVTTQCLCQESRKSLDSDPAAGGRVRALPGRPAAAWDAGATVMFVLFMSIPAPVSWL